MGQPESSPTTNEPTSNQLAADRTWMRSIAGLATRRRRSIAFVLAILIAILGTIAFVSAVLRQ